jgi:phosphopantetheinyl transferase (holo-ACP synthase)
MKKDLSLFFFDDKNPVFLSFFCQFCKMPLYAGKEPGKGQKLGIWHISESLKELLGMKELSGKDLSVLETFSHEHRRKEWLAARILTAELTGEKDVQIEYDVHSKPLLNLPGVHISISHSHDLLAVMLDSRPTGIDIEQLKDKVLNIREKFMSKEELASVQKENEAEQLTVYWCAKESLYKLYGKKELTFKKNLLIEPFHYAERGGLKGWIRNEVMNTRFVLHYEKINFGSDAYLIAHVIGHD